MQAGAPLSGVDRAWLLVGSETNPMVIVALIVLGQPLRRAALLRRLIARFVVHERFRCVPQLDALGARWVQAERFDPQDHLTVLALPEAADQAQLQRLVGELASTPLPPHRPLWSFHLIERYGPGSALLVRIHHCYADGIALVRVLLSLVDENHAQAPQHSSKPERLISGLHIPETLGEGFELLRKGLQLALDPGSAASAIGGMLGFGGELAHVSTLPDDPPTRLKSTLSGARRVAWGEPLPLIELATIAHALGCTVNDVLMSTLAGALGRYLRNHGERVASRALRAVVPVNLRASPQARASSAPAAIDLGNRFGLVFVELPIGIRDPLERLQRVHAGMQALKGSPQPLVTLALLALVGVLPAGTEAPIMSLFSAKASLVASNLPGPLQLLRLCGAPIEQLLFWVPQAGAIGTGVSMLSYRDHLQFGVMADRETLEAPDELVRHMREEFERLLLLVLLASPGVD